MSIYAAASQASHLGALRRRGVRAVRPERDAEVKTRQKNQHKQ